MSCNLAGNPLHEEQLEIVKILGDGILGLNTVIDEERDLNFVSFGEIIASHGAAVDFVRASTEVPVGRKFNTVVTSSAGYPLDQTFYQTVKGMVTPLDILAPGGTLIIVSDCAEGMGSPEFRASQGRLVELGPDRFRNYSRQAIRRCRRMADRDAVEANAGRPCTAIFYRFAGRRPWPDRSRDAPEYARCGGAGGRRQHRQTWRRGGGGDPGRSLCDPVQPRRLRRATDDHAAATYPSRPLGGRGRRYVHGGDGRRLAGAGRNGARRSRRWECRAPRPWPFSRCAGPGWRLNGSISRCPPILPKRLIIIRICAPASPTRRSSRRSARRPFRSSTFGGGRGGGAWHRYRPGSFP